MCFNPRTHEGCDNLLTACVAPLVSFQSTHPRGVRQKWFAVLIIEGVSIHAPTRGATPTTEAWISESLFQSTHPRGVRRFIALDVISSFKFQSTHPRGVRPPPCSPSPCGRMFQSTHPRGVRRRSASVTIRR